MSYEKTQFVPLNLRKLSDLTISAETATLPKAQRNVHWNKAEKHNG